MESIIKSQWGTINYFNDYGFDYIAQYVDEWGIYFANYTKQRIDITPTTSNIVALFRITKRKTKANKVKYIVYNSETLVINTVFDWMGKDVIRLLAKDLTLKCLNTTHPRTKSILHSINLVNGTNY